jgi:hypothetical protein
MAHPQHPRRCRPHMHPEVPITYLALVASSLHTATEFARGGASRLPRTTVDAGVPPRAGRTTRSSTVMRSTRRRRAQTLFLPTGSPIHSLPSYPALHPPNFAPISIPVCAQSTRTRTQALTVVSLRGPRPSRRTLAGCIIAVHESFKVRPHRSTCDRPAN